jgi:hypothetical protein
VPRIDSTIRKNKSKGKSQNAYRKVKTEKRRPWKIAVLAFAVCALPFDVFFSPGFALCVLRFAF